LDHTDIATAVAASAAARPQSRLIAGLAALWLTLGLAAHPIAQPAPVIAAASNLNFALVEVARQFARRGAPVDLVFASGALTRQIHDGARVAIANPEVAPYGRAAEAGLGMRGLWEVLRPYLVLGDTISQDAQFAPTGNAAGGTIACSLVLASGLAERGRSAVLPDADHPALRQRMVLLKLTGPVAERFFVHVQGPEARAIFSRYGFEVPK
jgi:molybdate transport system substrate-binding protein